MQSYRGFFLAIAVAAGAACYSNVDDVPPMAVNRGDMPNGPARDYGAFVKADRQLPPISGGTLTLSADGVHAYAADSDRDLVYVVDLDKSSVKTVALNADDWAQLFVEAGASLC